MGQEAALDQRLLGMARRWLAQKEFTTFEVRAALLRAGGDPDIVAQVLDGLAREGMLDEQRTAWRHVLRRSARLRGPEVISRELRERGVAPALIRELLERIPDQEWNRYAGRVLERYYSGDSGNPRRGRPRGRPLHDPATFLRMRGFRAPEIEAVLETALPATDPA